MMKKFLLSIVAIIMVSGLSYSQDRIVTDKNDTILCKIIKVDNYFVTYKTANKSEQTSTLSLNKAHVKTIEYGNGSPMAVKPTREVTQTKKYNNQSFRLALDYGYSYRLAEVSESTAAVQSHEKRLKNGRNLGLSGSLFWNINNGFGFKYSNFKSSSSVDIDLLVDEITYETVNVNVEEDVSISYFGPVYYYSTDPSSSNVRFLTGLSLGYMKFKDVADIENTVSVDMEGETIGFGTSLGVDFMLSKNFALAIEAEGILGSLSEVTIDGESVDLEDGDRIGLSRINLNIGLRIY